MNEPKAGEWWWVRHPESDEDGEPQPARLLLDGHGGETFWDPHHHDHYASLSEVTPARRIPTASELAELERERDEARADRARLLAFVRDRQRAAVAGGDDFAAEIMLGFLRGFDRDHE